MKNDLKARMDFHANTKAADRAAVKQAATRAYTQISNAADDAFPFVAMALTLQNN